MEVVTEERTFGGTLWIALRARGADWSWLAPADAVRLGREWMLKYGSTEDHKAVVKHLISWLGDSITRQVITERLERTTPEKYAMLARVMLGVYGKTLDPDSNLYKIRLHEQKETNPETEKRPDSAQRKPHRRANAAMQKSVKVRDLAA